MVEKRVVLPWGPVDYIVHGEGPILAFFHGGSVTPRAYIPLIGRLGSSYTVIAPTHPGHGASFSPPESWRITDFSFVYKTFFETIDIAPTYLVGHSLGGAMALLLASEGVGSRAVVMDPAGLPFSFTTSSYLRARKREARDLFAYRKDKKRVEGTLSATGVLLHTAITRFKDMIWFASWIPKADITSNLKSIRIPVALLWGADDGVVPVSVGKKMHQLISGSTFTLLAKRGHTYPVTDPEFAYQSIVQALQ